MRKPILIIISFVILAIAVGLALLLRPFKSPAPQIIPSAEPSPVVTPSETPNPEKAVVEQRAKELASKYFTYDNPASPEYAASVRPYVTDELYGELLKTNASAGKFQVPAIRSTAEVTNVELGPKNAASDVTVSTTEPATGKKYTQRLQIIWDRPGGVWLAAHLDLLETTDPDSASFGSPPARRQQ